MRPKGLAKCHSRPEPVEIRISFRNKFTRVLNEKADVPLLMKSKLLLVQINWSRE